MNRNENVKPLDILLDEKIKEFESGIDKEYDTELDEMIWELGDYETEEPLPEAEEFPEKVPIEEDLVEKKRRTAKKRS
ncbi:MAG TPA: hypothetical protein VMT12_06015 [Syntrophales bacterium]|nr:hypothetical protein [Syntrophales bacterium]